jgi:uncharacterized protein (UPF0261 family)
VVLVAGTLDTKGAELRYVRDIIRAAGLPVRMVDLSTSGGHSGAEIPRIRSRRFIRAARRACSPATGATRWPA